MEFSEGFMSQEVGDELLFDFLPRGSLEDAGNDFDVSNLEDMQLINQVLDNPNYILNPRNPLNPLNTANSFDIGFEPPDHTAQMDEDMKMVDADIPCLSELKRDKMAFYTLPDGTKKESFSKKTGQKTKKSAAKNTGKKRRVYETVVATPDGSLESRHNQAQFKLEEKKRKHRIIEQTRRNKLNEGFKNLGLIVQKTARADILSAAIDRLQEFEDDQREAKQTIDRLKQEVADSELKAKQLSLRPLYVNRKDVDYREVFLNSGVAMSINRIDGNFIDCNIAFEELTGYTRAELLTTNMFALTHREDLPKMFACVRGMLTHKFHICKAVKKWIQKNGQSFSCSCMISVVNDMNTGKVKYFVCFGPPKESSSEDILTQEAIASAAVVSMAYNRG